MRDYEDYPPEEREARQHLDALRDFVEALPAELYNNNREYWDGKIRAAEILLDELIDRRLGKSVEQPNPAETAYALEQAMDAEVMDEISAAAREDSEWREGWNGFCDELRGHVGADNPRESERFWDAYCAEVEETNRDLGEWARGR